MHNIYLSALALFISCSTIIAQCPGGDVDLFTQAQVDNFANNFPNCTIINGNLDIGDLNTNPSDITDLSPLANLTTIEGSLDIANNPVLENLNGLSNLTSIAGIGMVINLNSLLSDISGLNNISFTSNDAIIFINDNPQLMDCAITSICTLLDDDSATIFITDNGPGCDDNNQVSQACEPNSPDGDVNLVSQTELDEFVTNFPGVTTITGNLIIGQTIGALSDITDLSGLSDLVSVGGEVSIQNNGQLQNISGLASLSNVGADFTVISNSLLTDLSGLGALTEISGDLIIQNNASLDSFTGLTGLEVLSGDLKIVTNDALTDLSSLMTLQEIGADLVIINNKELTNLNGFTDLKKIGSGLDISRNNKLVDITALSNLDSISSLILIKENPILPNLTGLDNIEGLSPSSIINISENDALVDISSLSPMANNIGGVFIINNGALVNLPDLSSVNQIGDFLTISGNPQLTSLSNLAAIASVDNLFIDNNAGLTNLDGLSSLESISAQLYIGNNEALNDLTALSNLQFVFGNVTIDNNAQLSSLAGLENINLLDTDNVEIFDNPMLSACAIANLCAYLFNNGNANIENNAMGCNNRDEVLEACPNTNNFCNSALVVDDLLGQELNTPQTTDLINNADNTAIDTPTNGTECFLDGSVTSSVWFSFTGDGNTYRITTVSCSASDSTYLDNTQMAVYRGDCTSLTALDCNEDQDLDNNLLNAEIFLTTEADSNYYLLVDGLSGFGESPLGDFCLEITQIMPNAVRNPSIQSINLYPNPTTGQVQLQLDNIRHLRIFNNQGQAVNGYRLLGQELDMSDLASGLYYLHIQSGDQQYRAKLLKM